MRLSGNNFACALVLIMFVVAFSCSGSGYSVLTHEQVVDLMWKDQIQPLLLKRFPGTTEAELLKAHAYAYGGSLVQDMGYYPFGSKFFSDLVQRQLRGHSAPRFLRCERLRVRAGSFVSLRRR